MKILKYISVPEAAKKWGISERRVQAVRGKPHTRCSKIQLFMADSKKRKEPKDARMKTERNKKHE